MLARIGGALVGGHVVLFRHFSMIAARIALPPLDRDPDSSQLKAWPAVPAGGSLEPRM